MWYRKEGYEGPAILEAYFKKKKSDTKLGFFSNYNKRWFMLDFEKATLSYSAGPQKKVTCIVPFKDILKVKSDLDRDVMRLTTSAKKLKLLANQLVIYTRSKVYTLYAENGNIKSNWAYALKFIVKSRNENSIK